MRRCRNAGDDGGPAHGTDVGLVTARTILAHDDVERPEALLMALSAENARPEAAARAPQETEPEREPTPR